ncbi:hypothetical protein [Vulgatibacter sp.]|uniref:hypothetical protein n=1 Tax=Vulgatibacter sp. TaxID=1971226 RepID=UPI0035687070
MQRGGITLAVLVLSTACASQQRVDGTGDEPSGEIQAEILDPELGGWAEEFSDVKLDITSPTWNEVVPPGDVRVKFDLENYAVWQDGAHIHLVLDDQPYIAVYDGAGYVLEDVAPGAHLLRAFPSRPRHESIKASPDAFVMVRFVVGMEDGRYAVDPEAPLLTWSRPKGSYAGEAAQRILFDYYLTNVRLSQGGYRVRWTLDGEEHLATEWQPLWWENLAPGEHEIEVDLVDEKGAPVGNGGLGPTARTFTVK